MNVKKPKTDKTYHDDYRLAQQLAKHRKKIMLQEALNAAVKVQSTPYAVIHLVNILNQIVYKLYGAGGYKFSYDIELARMVIDHGTERPHGSRAEQDYRIKTLNEKLRDTCERVGIPYVCKFIKHESFYHVEMVKVLYLEHSDQLVGALTI